MALVVMSSSGKQARREIESEKPVQVCDTDAMA